MGAAAAGNATDSAEPLAQIRPFILPPSSRVGSNYYFNFVLAESYFEGSTSFRGLFRLQTPGSGLLSTHEEHIGFPQTVLHAALTLLLVGAMMLPESNHASWDGGRTLKGKSAKGKASISE